jgi:hypothetical protein
LQVVSAQNTTEKSIATNTFADTNLTATITPTSASSTILILVSQPFSAAYTGGTRNSTLILLRGASTIWNTLDRANIQDIGHTDSSSTRDLASFLYVDSPSTTSATTYKTQARTGTGSITFQNTSHPSNIVLMEIGA